MGQEKKFFSIKKNNQKISQRRKKNFSAKMGALVFQSQNEGHDW
jgi:hypothetical protein